MNKLNKVKKININIYIYLFIFRYIIIGPKNKNI